MMPTRHHLLFAMFHSFHGQQMRKLRYQPQKPFLRDPIRQWGLGLGD